MSIAFHFIEIDNFPFIKESHSNWVLSILKENDTNLKSINYIFCSDKYLLELNKKHLGHNTLTDIITFDLSDVGEKLLADIYISVERVKENAIQYNASFENEIRRVMIHGIFHLLGYGDITTTEKATMRALEDKALKNFNDSQ